MRISSRKGEPSTIRITSMESKVKSLLVQMALMITALLWYAKKGGVLLAIAFGYFCANSCFILLLILLTASSTKRKIKHEEAVKAAEEKTVKSASPPIKTEEPEKKPGLNFQLSFRKKNKSIAPPKKIIIKKYEEYAATFKLTKKIEKEFKTWVLKNVVTPVVADPVSTQSRIMSRTQKILTQSEINDLKMMSGNGFICYDKNNELHSRALFKVLYNYFNDKIPSDTSFYANPMDEFVFDDISKIKISMFGLLVEDTESLIEGRKTFSVYFMNNNILYDTNGDVILSFLLLLIFANENEGRCLGALSLRGLPFLPK
ncbi:hypothetical protein NEMIN01_1541 [Nematocida minor]|uniref:uncharacterized protein n=1 Tax=Nematocida minor TaxID=1912983 RepID=UPI00221FDE53|nr:uncharacterized protein NEMIN01_1541 [Nematocida minor]KAI5191515.1 hypothetical protein NEMIN01_1541 [Nematocida minor]